MDCNPSPGPTLIFDRLSGGSGIPEKPFHLVTPLGVDPREDGCKFFQEACFTFAMGLLLILPGIAALWTVALLSERARRAAVATGQA